MARTLVGNDRKAASASRREWLGRNPVWEVERWLARRMLRSLGDPPIRMVLCDGSEVGATKAPPVARLLVRDRWTLVQLAACPEMEFGEAYSEGRLEVDGDLVELVKCIFSAKETTARSRGLLSHVAASLSTMLNSNSLSGSRRHIHHHYDLGNDFYSLWLDEQMLYTCAYFPTPQADLEAAQRAKMDHVCRKLWLTPGDTVVEAGCGWGALALHMARHFGVTVHAYNISQEQIAFARERARRESLDGQVHFFEDDYRSISGQFDAFVSVGMLEHVGRDHFRGLGRVIQRCLKPDGRGLIHSIGQCMLGEPLNPWIRRRIFPGAYTPSLEEMSALLEREHFAVLDVENLRLHYARTLEHWLTRFEANAYEVRRRFDSAFVRMWRLYLAGSMAAFLAGQLHLFQVVFARPTVNAIPWTRAGLYAEEVT
jgi:cyclopropane-fatty-acyl-phospholipid synthase